MSTGVVDRTRPSTACSPCRQRRAKASSSARIYRAKEYLLSQCDRKRPICTRCVKTPRQCVGYRDSFELLFRDSTRKTALHYDAQPVASSDPDQDESARGLQAAPPSLDCGGVSESLPSVHDEGAKRALYALYAWERLSQPLLQPVEASAIAKFTQAFEGSVDLDYIPGLLVSVECPRAFHSCLESAAMMYFAQCLPYSHLLTQARKSYGTALHELNKSLFQAQGECPHSTLASIMLLALSSTLFPVPSQDLST